MSRPDARAGDADWNDASEPRPSGPRFRASTLLLFALPLALAAFRYHPLLQNYLYGDDFLNLYHIVEDPLPRYLVTPNGGHVLLARNAIFWASRQLFGTEPAPYFWTVLLTHLVNVALVFRVLRALTASALLASFGALAWGSSPLNEGTLGWYSVYGQVVVATAILAILDQALRGREAEPSRGTRALWYVLALVAASSFGTGTAVAFVLPLVLALLARAPSAGLRRPLWSLVVVVPLFYVAQVWAYQRLSGTDLHAVETYGKLLSDGGAIAAFWVTLTAFGFTRLLSGPLSPTTPAIWYVSLGALAVVVAAAAVFADAEGRRRLLACVLLVVVTYGIIALGRGALAFLLRDSPIAAVPLVTRYHYNGQLFLTLLLCVAVAHLPRPAPRVLIAACWGVLSVAYLVWRVPIDHHDDARRAVAQVFAAIHQAVAQVPPGATVRIPNRGFAAFPFAPTTFPGWAAVFVAFHPDDVVDGRRVTFVERNPAVLEAVRGGRRMHALLVPP